MRAYNRTKTLSALAMGPLILAASALADDVTSGHSGLETLEEKSVDHQLRVSPGISHIATTDFDRDQFDDVTVTRADTRVGYSLTMPQGELGLGAFYEYSWYELGIVDDEDLTFNRLSFDAYYKGMVNENWGYFGYGAITLSAATDASLGDGTMGTVAGGARYVWSESLSLGFGAAISTALEDDPRVLPVIALNWQINDRLNLRTLNGATITYDITGEQKFFVDGSLKYHRREYRLDEDNVGTDEASLIESMFVGEAGLTYRFTPKFALRGFVGLTAAREFEVRADDDKVADEDVDPAPTFGLRAMLTF